MEALCQCPIRHLVSKRNNDDDDINKTNRGYRHWNIDANGYRARPIWEPLFTFRSPTIFARPGAGTAPGSPRMSSSRRCMFLFRKRSMPFVTHEEHKVSIAEIQLTLTLTLILTATQTTINS